MLAICLALAYHNVRDPERRRKHMALVEVSIVPLGTGGTSLSYYVARAVKVLREEGAKYQLTAMGTIIEGEMAELMRLVVRMHQAVLAEGVDRVLTTVKVDDRRDKPATLTSKVEAVKKALES
jgi:uncharacterized protein (TIGR00106 family)